MSTIATTRYQGARASADLLIDRDRLSELLGRPVRATRLRFKPGLSTSAALLDLNGGRPPGWIQVSHEAHLDKLRNALRRSGQASVQIARVGDLTIAHGEIDSDPRLQRGLDALRTAHPVVSEGLASGRLEVLRYNPQRRLVLRRALATHDDQVLRVTAHRQARVRRELAECAAAGVPVLQPLRDHDLPGTRRLTVWPWFGRGDLSRVEAVAGAGAPRGRVVEAARAAGQALARLHHSGVVRTDIADPAAALAALVDDLAEIDLSSVERMGAIVSDVAPRIHAWEGPKGLIHGDFSADQVLVGREGEDAVVLTDFDRAGHGPLIADLASFAAAELLATPPAAAHTASPPTAAATNAAATTAPPTTASPTATELFSLPLTRALQEGYGSDAPSASSLSGEEVWRGWVARSLLLRVMEPFRGADPEWEQAVHQRLDQIEEILR